MECEVDRKEFLAAVRICKPVANGRVKPILGCVRLEFKGDTCLMQASNGENAIQVSVPLGGETLVDGVICVSVELLASVLSAPGGDTITLTLGDELLVKTANAKHKLLLTDATEFPKLPAMGKTLAKVSGSVLATAIQRVVYACSDDGTRYAFNGVLFDFGGHGWNLVATDGRRLSICKVSKSRRDEDLSVIVPSGSCRFAANLFADCEEEIELGISTTNASLMLQSGTACYWSRLIEGRFPRYSDVIPKSHHEEAYAPAGLLLNAIQESRIYTNKESRGVTFTFHEDYGLRITVSLASVGSAEVTAPVRYESQPLAIDLDARLVAEFLSPLGAGKSVAMRFSGPEGSAVFEVDGGDYLGVIMPLVLD